MNLLGPHLLLMALNVRTTFLHPTTLPKKQMNSSFIVHNPFKMILKAEANAGARFEPHLLMAAFKWNLTCLFGQIKKSYEEPETGI